VIVILILIFILILKVNLIIIVILIVMAYNYKSKNLVFCHLLLNFDCFKSFFTYEIQIIIQCEIRNTIV